MTTCPNVLWGTDGAKAFTLDEGWIWIFVAVEHWNAEGVGWHVTKRGDRDAALDPLAQGLTSLFGTVGADAARGLVVRMDHGTQYLLRSLRAPTPVLGHYPELRLRGGARDQRGGGALHSHAAGTQPPCR
jgi:hypothetical protein